MFSPVPQDKNYCNIIQQIKSAIINGDLKVGDQLPTEHELTEIFNVSRSSVREALKALEVLGMLESRKGGGSFIVNRIFYSMSDSLSMYFMLENGTVRDLIRMRESIELGAARELIFNGSDQDIEKLGEQLKLYLNAKTIEERQKYDQQFHLTLVTLSGNPLFEYTLNALSLVFEKDVFDSHKVIEENGQLQESFDIHTKIYEAIKNRDGEKATSEIYRHFDFSEQDLSLKVKYFKHM